MNADIFAQWLERQGHHVIRTESSYWFDQGPRVYQAFPYHWTIQPSQEELTQFLKQNKALGLRYSTPVDAPEGAVSYHVMYSGECYCLAQLPKKARYDVRKGMDCATIEPITFSRLAEEGWALRLETLTRQGRVGAETVRWWWRLCLSADGLAGFEAWGAICEGKLIGALLTFTMDDCCGILYQQSSTAHLKSSINNALTYVVTNDAICRLNVSRIFYGLHSLDAPSSVDDFKFRMGYKAMPVRQRVVLHPVLAPVVNKTSYALIARLRTWFPGNTTLAKSEGMVRFYLEGRRPLMEQDLPPALKRDAHKGLANA